VRVVCSATDGSASAGDYEAVVGTLTFGAGETTKTFTVTIKDDAVPEPNKTVQLCLTQATGGAVLPSDPTCAVLWIVDDDP
jgi:hypothetical protein